jgi:hypothetical protein
MLVHSARKRLTISRCMADVCHAMSSLYMSVLPRLGKQDDAGTSFPTAVIFGTLLSGVL